MLLNETSKSTIRAYIQTLETVSHLKPWPKLDLKYFYNKNNNSYNVTGPAKTNINLAKYNIFRDEKDPKYNLTIGVLKKSKLRADLEYLNPQPNKITLRPQTYFHIQPGLLVSSCGLTREFKNSSMPQILFAQTLRRALILVANIPHSLKIFGIIASFGPL